MSLFFWGPWELGIVSENASPHNNEGNVRCWGLHLHVGARERRKLTASSKNIIRGEK